MKKFLSADQVNSMVNEGACYKTVYDTVTTTNNVTVQDTLNIYLSELICRRSYSTYVGSRE